MGFVRLVRRFSNGGGVATAKPAGIVARMYPVTIRTDTVDGVFADWAVAGKGEALLLEIRARRGRPVQHVKRTRPRSDLPRVSTDRPEEFLERFDDLVNDVRRNLKDRK